jgi:hypothetical protein
MRIAIIGTGNVGAALAGAWRRVGHEVTFGSRSPGREVAGCPTMGLREAAAWGEVVVIALPWEAAAGAAAALGDLSGKVVIDCMNPLGRGPGGMTLTVGHTDSSGEALARMLPGARVVKTLNTVGAEVMADARAFAHPPAMLVAGDDADAKATVAGLLSGIGFEPLDAGALAMSRYLEPFAMVWINQAIFRGKGRAWAFAALEKAP